MASVSSSMESVILYDGEKVDNKRYAISFQCEDAENISEILKICDINDDDTMWLSWTIFDKTIQSTEFTLSSVHQFKSKETIFVSCTEAGLMENFPFVLYLCCEKKIIAMSEISNNLFNGGSVQLPVNAASRACFAPADGPHTGVTTNASMKVSISVQYEALDVPSHASSSGKKSNVLRGIAEREETDDDYEEDGFDSEGSEYGDAGEASDSARESRAQKPSARPKEKGKGKDKVNFDDETGEDTEDGEDEKEEAEFVDEYQNTHFRMSIDVRSIGGLKRSSHVMATFVYPHFGSNAHVRSKPMWVRGNSPEMKVENATATYDFCMDKAELDSICASYPLSLHILAKTNLGNEPFGCVQIHLTSLLSSKVHSVRCPITNRSFKTLSGYAQYRSKLMKLHQKELANYGLSNSDKPITEVPPPMPVVIRAVDSYYAVTEENSGKHVAKVRVVLILEKIAAVVGQERAIPVQPGYKMHNAAVYKVPVDSHGETVSSMPHSNADPNPPPPPPISQYPHSADFSNHVDQEMLTQKMKLDMETEVAKMKKKLALEMSKEYASKADDLRRAQEEVNRLELKLRSTIEAAERQRTHLLAQEESMNMKLTQKTHELQLLQRRIRDEAAVKIEAEVRRANSLQHDVEKLKEEVKREKARYHEVDGMYEKLRAQVKGMSEMQLKDEISRYKAHFLDCKAELERERRQKAEAVAEKEHYRAQMHRLALALKREREKSATLARQDLEQLRLEYLAREER